MPLNKLDNFIKNTEGRILYVSPADLDATDGIDNTGNSLARPFKTIQRALIESARFSYIQGNSNDLVEKTTILLMPGEHIVDNRPGFRIKDNSGAKVISPSGTESAASDILDLNSSTLFDLTQEDNVLYKFNSVEGGVIVPRGTSIVGLDLRKTKIRPKYIPNPTSSYDIAPASAIFRITGACYLWQFSIFDGDENSEVYTNPVDFSNQNKSRPLFSHHKLTVFEYADGVNKVSDSTGNYELTDLDMYYAKLSNAYNTASGNPNREIERKYPTYEDEFSKQRPEWEIVGAFAADPIEIESIISGDGITSTPQITVTTVTDHGLNAGTPIRITGVTGANVDPYNISTKVQSVSDTDPRVFTYLLASEEVGELTASPGSSNAEVTIETDTVSGASPYIFNVSMRSVWGMNGMHADGAKASGFRSMVVAQFTGVSLQKDDRAFVKYDKSSGNYDFIPYLDVNGSELSKGSSAQSSSQVYHLDSQAVYRSGWEQTHIRVSNDAILQIVSVFAIGYNKHFVCESGGDASITNSNSNFGQLSLVADGFKKEAFGKDNKAFITNIIPPKSIISEEDTVDWLPIDVGVTTSVADNTRLYISGFETEDSVPGSLIQGYRIGAKINDKLFLNYNSSTYEADILMNNASGSSSYKEFSVSGVSNNEFTIGSGHGLLTGEKVFLISDSAEYPENIIPHQIYYAIVLSAPDDDKIKLASTATDADNGNEITLYNGNNLRILSRVSDKSSGEIGHPIQFDSGQSRWYINVNAGNTIYPQLTSIPSTETDLTYIKRTPDERSLDDKIYKMRIVVPKELLNGKTPESGFVIQESSSTGANNAAEFTDTTITINDYEYKKNLRLIAECSHTSTTSTVRTELPHNLNDGDKVIIRNVTDSTNTTGEFNEGYNGTFTVTVTNNMVFTYTNTQSPGASSTNDTSVRDQNLPRFERNDLQSNFYIYRNEVISEYIEGQQDGIYYVYALKGDNAIVQEFTDLKFSQNVTDLYPQLDRDNPDDSPSSTSTNALSYPIGEVHTSDLKNSITREASTDIVKKLKKELVVSSIPSSNVVEFTRDHEFGGVVSGTLGGTLSGRGSDGDYYNVKLYNTTTFNDANWNGATAKVTITSGSISDIEIQSPGSAYNGETELYIGNQEIGGGTGGFITISDSTIKKSIGDVVQVTGISTISDAYYRITNVPETNRIGLARTSGDPLLASGQNVFIVGPSIDVNTSSFTSGITTFTCSTPHGLVAGNRFKVTDSSNNNLGDYIVKSKVGVNTFTAETTSALASPAYILKHYFSANSGVSDASEENISGRGVSFYDGDTLETLDTVGVTTNFIPVSHPYGTDIIERFPLGSYIQIEEEIMRISSSTLTGVPANKLKVLRGVLSSKTVAHPVGSLIKKIDPLPVEFRRPSIIRASGHTFEYLGYGPGNYSTGLPQVQDRTLSEREEFLSQAQERSSGIVVYTGMNNKGDFYIGNTRKSSTTGEEVSYDTPIPTITGENPSRLSAVFDEITVKERIVVEGGDSGQILSQFDGPVAFNRDVRIREKLTLKNQLRIDNNTNSESPTTGAVVITGGLGVGQNVSIGGSMFFPDDKKLNFGNSNDLQISHRADFSSQLDNAGDTITSGSANIIEDAGDGPLIFKSNSGTGQGAFQFFDEDWNPMLKIHSNGRVRLYHGNNGEKLRTISTGVKITGELQVTDDITAFWTSDERLKDNITPIENSIAKILSISGNTFDWNEKSNKEGHDVGLIAQEIEQVLPEAVVTRDNGYLAVDYHKVVPLLVEAIKELTGKVDALEQKLSDK